jgi:hypothetical protein
MSGSGLSAADRNKKIRQEALRDQLANKGLVQQVLEISEKIGDLSQDFEKDKIDRLKIAADLKMKLVAKYLPDLRQTDLDIGVQEDNPLLALLSRISGKTLDPQ